MHYHALLVMARSRGPEVDRRKRVFRDVVKAHPLASNRELQFLLKEEGVSYSLKTIISKKSILRSKRILPPQFPFTPLGSTRAAVRKEIYYSPSATNDEIVGNLREKGVSMKEVMVAKFRTRMRKEGYSLPFLRKKVQEPLPVLSQEQKVLLKRMRKHIPSMTKTFKLNSRIGYVSRRNVMNIVNKQAQKAAFSYDTTREANEKKHLAKYLRFLHVRIYRDSVREKLGVSARTAEKIMTLLRAEREKIPQGIVLERLRISAEQAQSLLDAHRKTFKGK